jgi:hypothetical protein
MVNTPLVYVKVTSYTEGRFLGPDHYECMLEY